MSTNQLKEKSLCKAIKASLVSSGLAVAVLTPGTVFAEATSQQTIDQLRQQIQILTDRINTIEVEQEKTTAVAEEVVQTVEAEREARSSTPGYFKIPGTDTEVEISGYVKADFIYDTETDLGDSFIASSAPTSDNAGDGHTRFHARQSRIRVKSNSDLGNGTKIGTHIEGDFFGGGGNESFSNSTGFRIRHAAATFTSGSGTLLVGQYWSNFGDFVAYPGTVDFFGPAGKVFARQAQIRYSFNNGFEIALENPETDGSGAAGRLDESRGGIGRDETPDITIAWRNSNLEFSGVLRDLTAVGTTEVGEDGSGGVPVNVSETGWGINLAGGVNAGPVYLSSSVTFGEGVGDYIINGFGNGLFIDESGNGEAVESLSYNFAAKFNWTDSTSSLIAFGHFENDNPARSNGLDTVDTLHINYKWAPFPSTSMGVELILGEVDFADGSSGDATRLQFGVQRNF